MPIASSVIGHEMARRLNLHLTEVCALASGSGGDDHDLDLSALGLGEREGWLDDPSLLASLSPRDHSLALAHPSKSLILVLASTGGRVGNGDYAVVSRIRPSFGESDGSLAAIEWVPSARDGERFVGGDDDKAPVLAVGTTLGYLLFYSLGGELIHKQVLLSLSHPPPPTRNFNMTWFCSGLVHDIIELVYGDLVS
jgi:Rab3 GTPase-activating protein non-catalytic subunit